VTCTGYSHDSKFLSTGDMSGMIKVWELQTGQEVWNFECGGDLEVNRLTSWLFEEIFIVDAEGYFH